MSVGAIYDTLAAEYDAALARDPVAVWMRAVLWSHYDRIFPTGARVLDFTAGTGADAFYLAQRGVRVLALDASPRMLQELERGARARGLAIDTIAIAAERLSELRLPPFDGALSSFGGLNSISDLTRLAQDLSALLKPRALLLLHALNATCLWQSLGAFVRGRKSHTRAPLLQGAEGHIELRLYNPFSLYRDFFDAYFELRQVYGLSLVASPRWVKRAGRAAPLLFRVDRALGRILPARGDFFVMELVKR